MMKKKVIGMVILFALLASCSSEYSSVQKQFVSDRRRCNSKAEDVSDVYFSEGKNPVKDKKTITAAAFCECMKDKDWQLYGCPKPKKAETEIPKTVVPPSMPTIAAPAASLSAPATPPASSQPQSYYIPSNGISVVQPPPAESR